MTTLMPRDADGNAIPILRPRADGAHKITVTAVSARNAAPFDSDTRAVALYATGSVFIRFGDASVTAADTDHYLPAGLYQIFSLGGGKEKLNTHVAAIRESVDCTLHVSELD